jgi:hypothetical protein
MRPSDHHRTASLGQVSVSVFNFAQTSRDGGPIVNVQKTVDQRVGRESKTSITWEFPRLCRGGSDSLAFPLATVVTECGQVKKRAALREKGH